MGVPTQGIGSGLQLPVRFPVHRAAAVGGDGLKRWIADRDDNRDQGDKKVDCHQSEQEKCPKFR
jgi:hypothetical protein